ncbi:hypothetical protein [Actinoplanes sp. M2I2]|uniref:hypothetical protein n=1 Tax=Actinoplanes sp. M2I2 TaxID=1734444 RepID=UPI0020227646|nr:hypothetical protein [Actinoplanes sp. M2I2]
MAEFARDRETGHPEQLLADLTRIRGAVRRDRQASAFPLLVFGVLTLASTPLYLDPVGPDELRASHGDPALAGLGGDLLQHSGAIGWYWLAALLAGYLGTLVWYRRHALKVGVQTRTRNYLTAGVLGVLGGLALGPVLNWLAIGTSATVSDIVRPALRPVYALLFLGLVPILVIAVGLLVLARLERSRLLAVTGGLLIALLAVAPVYVNTVPFGDDTSFGYVPTVLLPALVLLVGGVVATVRARRTRA